MKSKHAPRILAALASISILCCATVRAQTLQFRYTFEDGPGTTTTDDPDQRRLSGSPEHEYCRGDGDRSAWRRQFRRAEFGARSLNLSTNNIVGNANGAWAVITNDATLGAGLGVVSDFTATIWFKMPACSRTSPIKVPRLWMIAPTGAVDLNVANNTIGLQFGSRSAASQAPTPTIDLNAGDRRVPCVTPSIYYDFPTNVWLYCAMVYDSVGGNCYVYYGSEASPAKLYAIRAVAPGTSFDLSAGASLAIGNRIMARTRFHRVDQ